MTRVIIAVLFIIVSKTIVFGQSSPFDEKTIYSRVISAFLRNLSTEEQILVIQRELDKMDLSEIAFIDSAVLRSLLPLTSFNANRQILDNLVLADYKLIFASRKELGEMFKKKSLDSWKDFYKKYPKSGGLLKTSQIYLNSSKTKGLIYISILKGSLGGAGYVIYFDMTAPEIIKLTQEIWVS